MFQVLLYYFDKYECSKLEGRIIIIINILIFARKKPFSLQKIKFARLFLFYKKFIRKVIELTVPLDSLHPVGCDDSPQVLIH